MRVALPSLLLVILSGSVWMVDAFAQGRRNRFSIELSTLTSVKIETGNLEAPAQLCGIAAGDLEAPVRASVGASRLRVRDAAPDVLFVNVAAVVADDVCVAAIDVELYRWSTEFQTSVSVWERKGVLAAGKEGLPGQVRERIAAMTREFVTDWDAARK